jgi:hypothetical protein
MAAAVRGEEKKDGSILGGRLATTATTRAMVVGCPLERVVAVRWPTSAGTTARLGACWRRITGDSSHWQCASPGNGRPICTGNLRGKFGYNAITRTAMAILNETYKFPPDFDQATKEICEECARIREMIPINSMDIIITKEQWRRQWKGQRKATLSLESGLHFGHYCRSSLGPLLIFPRTESNSYYPARCSIGALGTWTLRYARENVWVCAHN